MDPVSEATEYEDEHEGTNANLAPEESEPSPSASVRSEMEDIMKQVERLEKSHYLMESFLNPNLGQKDEEKSSTEIISSRRNSKLIVGSGSGNELSSFSKPFTSSKALSSGLEIETEDEISNALSMEMDSLRQLLDQGAEDRVSKPKQRPVSQEETRSVDELLEEYDTLEQEIFKEGDLKGGTSALSTPRKESKKSPYEAGYGVAGASVQMKIKQLDPVPLSSRTSKSLAVSPRTKTGVQAKPLPSRTSQDRGKLTQTLQTNPSFPGPSVEPSKSKMLTDMNSKAQMQKEGDFGTAPINSKVQQSNFMDPIASGAAREFHLQTAYKPPPQPLSSSRSDKVRTVQFRPFCAYFQSNTPPSYILQFVLCIRLSK
jgi:hypothetical protein